MSTSDVAKRYFAALAAHDLDAAVACWAPGGIDRFVGQQELIAPDGVREYFERAVRGVPGLRARDRRDDHYREPAAVRWRARGDVRRPGRFQGFAPNGARIEIEGCDVVTVAGRADRRATTRTSTAATIARQLGLLPPAGSRAEARLTRLANARTRLGARIQRRDARADRRRRLGRPRRLPAQDDERLPARGRRRRDGVRRRHLRDDAPRSPRPARGSAGSSGSCSATPTPTTAAPRPAWARRSTAIRPSGRRPSPPTRSAPTSTSSKLNPHGRLRARAAAAGLGRRRRGDRGNRRRRATRSPGFRVIELPGHAPGLIGLYRESDRLALVSDCFYTLDPQTGHQGRRRGSRTRPSTSTSSRRARRSASSRSSSRRGRLGRPRRSRHRRRPRRSSSAPPPRQRSPEP